MRRLANSPVQPVTFGQALSISLDNYYDLLKQNAATLVQEEYLQLKLVADPVAISNKKASDGGYRWYSYYNLLERSDLEIVPTAISGQVMASVVKLSDIYGTFLRKLRTYVVIKNFAQSEQKQIDDLDSGIDDLKSDSVDLAILDRKRWKDYATAMGYSLGDWTTYEQWSVSYGHLKQIQDNLDQIKVLEFKKNTILNRQFPDPTDRDIVEAEFNYDDPAMRLRYPVYADLEYQDGDQFDVTYMSRLPLGSSAMFDDRLALTWDLPLGGILGTAAGALSGAYSRNTQASSSITTDWGASAGVSYDFISVNASASEHTQIQQDFSQGTGITVASKSAFKLKINYPKWFNPALFENDHVKTNPKDFEQFFGDNGTLLYYPVALILVRGFEVTFASAQNWTYDYAHHFSASAGGGFNFCGVGFGSSSSYSQDTKEHQVDQSGTSLKFSDDENTIRFVGYCVRKNTVYQKSSDQRVLEVLGDNAIRMLNDKR